MPFEKITLSSSEQQTLAALRPITVGLGNYLGNGCEVALYRLDDPIRVVEVANGFHSGLTVDSPAPAFLKSMLENLAPGEHSSHCFFTRNRQGTQLKVSIITIQGDSPDRRIGALCLAFYMDQSLSEFGRTWFNGCTADDLSNPSGGFAPGIDALIIETTLEVRDQVMADPSVNASSKNRVIIANLAKRGVFKAKESVVTVAKTLGISRNTVYLHLRNLNGEAAQLNEILK